MKTQYLFFQIFLNIFYVIFSRLLFTNLKNSYKNFERRKKEHFAKSLTWIPSRSIREVSNILQSIYFDLFSIAFQSVKSKYSIAHGNLHGKIGTKYAELRALF